MRLARKAVLRILPQLLSMSLIAADVRVEVAQVLAGVLRCLHALDVTTANSNGEVLITILAFGAGIEDALCLLADLDGPTIAETG